MLPLVTAPPPQTNAATPMIHTRRNISSTTWRHHELEASGVRKEQATAVFVQPGSPLAGFGERLGRVALQNPQVLWKVLGEEPLVGDETQIASDDHGPLPAGGGLADERLLAVELLDVVDEVDEALPGLGRHVGRLGGEAPKEVIAVPADGDRI